MFCVQPISSWWSVGPRQTSSDWSQQTTSEFCSPGDGRLGGSYLCCFKWVSRTSCFQQIAKNKHDFQFRNVVWDFGTHIQVPKSTPTSHHFTSLHIISYDLTFTSICVFVTVGQGGDLNLTDENRQNVVHRAAHCGNLRLLRLLVENGGNIKIYIFVVGLFMNFLIVSLILYFLSHSFSKILSTTITNWWKMN